MSTTPPRLAGPSSDARPRGLAWTALVLSIIGLVLVLGGFVPIPWAGLAATVVGGGILLAAAISAIVALVVRRHGGTAVSATALVLSVLGGVVGGFALIVGALFTGLSANQDRTAPAPLPTVQATATASAEEAFLADLRPEVNEIMRDLAPELSEEDVASTLSDEMLIATGRALLVAGDAGIDAFVDQATAAAGGTVDTAALRSVYEAIHEAAQEHLR